MNNKKIKTIKKWLPLIVLLIFILIPKSVFCQNALPKVTFGLENTKNQSDFVPTLQIVFLITILSIAPSILIMMTSFTRIIIVFHFLRQSLATQTVPSNQILVGLALFITFFIMKPVITEVNNNALQPFLKKQISQEEALERAADPIRAFMLKQTREKDLKLFVDLQGIDKPKGPKDISMLTLIPAFIISELKTAFQIGFLLYLPMLLIDLVVGSILLSMGMMMLPPVMIAMPFKLLLFVLVDGWYLVVESLVRGF
ncbi:MAG: flagellar type III secretion system pore protein FliP [Calditrichales bacterium]|nr:flagellar type III secretion system pore protein FliP [Calditrichales bacterium]